MSGEFMSEETRLIELLKDTEFFGELDEASSKLVSQKMRRATYNAGDIICQEGESADWMFVVDFGEIRVVKKSEDDALIQVAVLGSGDMGGMQSLFERTSRSATLQANSAVKLWVLDHHTFDHLIATNTRLTMSMLAFMSKRMRLDSHNLAMALQYVDESGLRDIYEECSPKERVILDTINQKVMAAESLDAVMNFVFESVRKISQCDRFGLAFLEDGGARVVSHWAAADYEPILLRKGYAADLAGSSLAHVLESGKPRVINDLELYLKEHPRSKSTALIVREGIRASMTCPLVVENRPLGFLFRSSRKPNAYDDHQVKLHQAIAARLSQAVEKAYRIEQLTAANDAYFEMLGFVSHELKSPLASIVMKADVLVEGYLGKMEPRQVAEIEGIIVKSRHLLDLIGEYLNLSRLEGGQLEPNFRSNVAFNEDVLSLAVDTVLPQLDGKGMTLEQIGEETVGEIDCAPDLLRIVMINLLSNAIKYGNEGGKVRLSAQQTDGELEVSVWNEGPGFPKEERSKLFRKFSRIQTKELLKRKGTGVGLYTTWRIIQSHGGKIEARSEEGQWAEFAFAIPAKRSQESARA
jgi:signal transduction histidine kinase/CRP-like cAMP-binding protein